MLKKLVLVLAVIVVAGALLGNRGKTTGKPATSEALQDAPQAPQEQPFAFSVEVITIKHVGGKYRYFYRFRNEDIGDYTGKLEVTLHNDKGMTLGRASLEGTVHAGVYKTGYIDCHSMPTSIIERESAITVVKLKAGNTTVTGSVPAEVVR